MENINKLIEIPKLPNKISFLGLVLNLEKMNVEIPVRAVVEEVIIPSK